MKYFESYLRILRLLQAFFLGLVNWLNYTCTLIGSYIKMWQVRPWHTLLRLMRHFFVLYTF